MKRCYRDFNVIDGNEIFCIMEMNCGYKTAYVGNLMNLANHFHYENIDKKHRKFPKSIGSLIVALNRDFEYGFKFYLGSTVEQNFAKTANDGSYCYIQV